MSHTNSYYRSIFDQFDLNGDGSVSHNELGVALKAAGVSVTDAELKSMLQGADADANGNIEFAEFVTFLEAFASSRQQGGDSDQGQQQQQQQKLRVTQLFQAAAELNGFDLVAADDLRSLAAAADGGGSGCDVTAAEAATMATVAEALGSRSVDLDEFLALWRRSVGGGN